MYTINKACRILASKPVLHTLITLKLLTDKSLLVQFAQEYTLVQIKSDTKKSCFYTNYMAMVKGKYEYR